MIRTWWRNAPWLTLFSGLALLILIGLGTWQVQRLQWKQALIADMEAGLAAPPQALPSETAALDALNYRRVSVRGQFLHDREQHLGPRQRNRQSGLHLLTPLRLEDGRHLLVNRGWIPRSGGEAAIARPKGPVSLTGILRTRFAKGPFTPDYDAAAGLWFWYDLPGLSRETGQALLPAVLEVDADMNGTLPIGGITRVHIDNNHLQYALTWYGLAIALICVFVFFQRQRSST